MCMRMRMRISRPRLAAAGRCECASIVRMGEGDELSMQVLMLAVSGRRDRTYLDKVLMFFLEGFLPFCDRS